MIDAFSPKLPQPEPAKNILKSKTVGVQIAATAVAVGAWFGLDIDPEVVGAIYIAIMPIINIIVRKFTKGPVTVLPIQQ